MPRNYTDTQIDTLYAAFDRGLRGKKIVSAMAAGYLDANPFEIKLRTVSYYSAKWKRLREVEPVPDDVYIEKAQALAHSCLSIATRELTRIDRAQKNGTITATDLSKLERVVSLTGKARKAISTAQSGPDGVRAVPERAMPTTEEPKPSVLDRIARADNVAKDTSA